MKRDTRYVPNSYRQWSAEAQRPRTPAHQPQDPCRQPGASFDAPASGKINAPTLGSVTRTETMGNGTVVSFIGTRQQGTD